MRLSPKHLDYGHFACWLLGILLTGCSADFYQEKADAETNSILFARTAAVRNVEDESLDISRPTTWDAASLKENPNDDFAFLGDSAERESQAKLMPLDDALQTGVTHSRSYLATKESVFLEALDLTLARYRLSPIFGAGGDITRTSDARRAQGLNNLVASNTFARSQGASYSQLYKTGARLTADFSQDFLKFLSGNRSLNDSALAVSLVQPLLQGGGTTATLEALTQAERDVLYALRDFANFRREFIVSLVTDYYGVLQARDNVVNAYVAYRGFKKNVEREVALKDEGRRTETQIGQLKQALLLSETRWLNAIRTYQGRLDQFKITLGIPIETEIVLDDNELNKLKIDEPEITREQAIKIALVSRPDIETGRDRVDDAKRRIEVAKNDLKAGLDLQVDYDVISDPGDSTPGLNFDRRNISSNLDLDLPLDRKSERNNYRAALITRDFRERQYEQTVDQVRLQINDDWRALDLAQRNYEIAVEGVQLALRRLEEQELLFELGKGEARDLVDAQNDLVNAQNQRTSTLIDHTLARLRLWRDMGILYIKADGSWIEKLEEEPSVTAHKVQ